MTYNLKALQLDGAAARRVVRAEAPDVLLLQETPRWLRGRRRTRTFARDVGLVVVAGGVAGRGAAIAVAPRLLPHVIEGRGVAIETRLVRFRRGRPTPRGYALARLARSPRGWGDGGTLALVSVHLSALRPQRERHVPLYADLVAREAPDVVLGGDLNENPRGPSVQALQPPLRDADPEQPHTEPVDAPRTRLDGFLVGASVVVHGVSVPAGPDVLVASDHRPAVLELSW